LEQFGFQVQNHICSPLALNLLSPSSDQHQISPYHTSALQYVQVMRINELIPKDEVP